MANGTDKQREGLFIVDVSKFGLSHDELLNIEKDINAAVMKHLQAKAGAGSFRFLRPPGPPMGLWGE
jgi:hypothetical protein